MGRTLPIVGRNVAMAFSRSRNLTTDTGWRLVGKTMGLVHETHSVAEHECVSAARFAL